jgi:hypothetical protein
MNPAKSSSRERRRVSESQLHRAIAVTATVPASRFKHWQGDRTSRYTGTPIQVQHCTASLSALSLQWQVPASLPIERGIGRTQSYPQRLSESSRVSSTCRRPLGLWLRWLRQRTHTRQPGVFEEGLLHRLATAHSGDVCTKGSVLRFVGDGESPKLLQD